MCLHHGFRAGHMVEGLVKEGQLLRARAREEAWREEPARRWPSQVPGPTS